ncbi:hypothetical protein M5689_012327 [Euphorbia peplus]|nr:hypothetical protein M5689_012327 [Euphorbia peplus]
MVVRVQDARNLALNVESQLSMRSMRSRDSYRQMGGESSSINSEQPKFIDRGKQVASSSGTKSLNVGKTPPNDGRQGRVSPPPIKF